MEHSSKGFTIAAHTILIFLAVFCLLPMLLLIVSSITEESTLIRNGYSFIPSKIDFLAYEFLLADSKSVLSSYGVTLLVTAVGTVTNIIITILMAYPLSRKELPGRNIFAFIVFFTMIFSGGLVPTYIMWTQVFRIKNTIWAYILPTYLLNPVNVLMVRAYFKSNVPDSVLEAARIDGATEMKTLTRVVLPMALPITATIGLIVTLAYWNDWMNGLYYINDERIFSIQVLLNRMLLDVQFLQSSAMASAGNIAAQNLPSTGLKMAVATLGALPMLVLFPLFMRYFVKGITVGAVKG